MRSTFDWIDQQLSVNCLGSALFRDGVREWRWFNVSNSTVWKVQGAGGSVSIFHYSNRAFVFNEGGWDLLAVHIPWFMHGNYNLWPNPSMYRSTIVLTRLTSYFEQKPPKFGFQTNKKAHAHVSINVSLSVYFIPCTDSMQLK